MKIKHLTITGMLLAIGILLPFATSHGMGIPGTLLLPMHIPVLLCGFLCGPMYGALLGTMLPILNCILTGMPTAYPMAPIMVAELTTYGFVSGILFQKTRLHRKTYGVYVALFGAMLCGRVAYGLMFQILMALSGSLRALTVSAAIVTGIPGILIQFLLIPSIVLVLKRPDSLQQKQAVESAICLIRQETASCVVIRDQVIVQTVCGRGIAPMIRLYESGILKEAYVVDKIIGKASAMILVLAGAKGAYGMTVSKGALAWAKRRKFPLEYDKAVDAIINRKGDGICPMEQVVWDLEDETEALQALKEKLKQI